MLKTDDIRSGQRTIRRSTRTDPSFLLERRERGDSGCNMRRSSSALAERPHTACRLRNLADFIFSATTTRRRTRRRRRRRRRRMTVDDGGRRRPRRQFANSYLTERPFLRKLRYPRIRCERARRNSPHPSAGAAPLRFSMTRVIFSAIVISVKLPLHAVSIELGMTQNAYIFLEIWNRNKSVAGKIQIARSIVEILRLYRFTPSIMISRVVALILNE